ncbi:MAG TPA: hypothetical protein VEZ90_13430 [Blastocatellia bacterium]|nr:hypothetical protein [Blastocatellia bacterium]
MSDVPNARHRLLIASIAFFAVLVLGYGADAVLVQHPTWIFIDDLILAILAALVVYQYERERGRLLAEKLRVIREMNAYVRNELQILYASLEHLDAERVRTIEHSVERIDWALRELLPGGHVPEMPSARSIRRSAEESLDR